VKKRNPSLLTRLWPVLLVIVILVIGVNVLLASTSLIKPGSFLFPLQDSAEQTGVSLNGDALTRTHLQMNLLDRRSADLRASGGQPALEQVNIAFNRTLLALAQLRSDSRQALRMELLALFGRVQSALDATPGLAGTASQVFTAKLVEARRLVDAGPPTALDLTALSRIPLTTPLPGGIVSTSAGSGQSTNYAHPAFPLNGAHSGVACTTCHALSHANPSQCASCHEGRRPANHSAGDCSQCHTPTAWKTAIFNHTAAGATDCASCHAQVRPAEHYVGQCSLCHVAGTVWVPATVDHAAANLTDCQSCHAKIRPTTHYVGQCSLCHIAGTVWKPATVNHVAAKLTDCQSCHAAKRPANHYTGQCSLCHIAGTVWKPATVDHVAAKLTDCQSCHAAKRPANHYTGQCSACHTAGTAWLPARFNHVAAGATNCQGCHAAKSPANHYTGQCSACHTAGTAWLPANFNHAAAGATDCQSCHAAKRPANHFTGQCSLCHTAGTAWKPANFKHTFPLNHNGANGVCAKCHPNNPPAYTCFNCHNQTEITKKHAEEGISNLTNCATCHPTGRKP
jgi:hypothetical protein